jgi:hypothetical protein
MTTALCCCAGSNLLGFNEIKFIKFLAAKGSFELARFVLITFRLE